MRRVSILLLFTVCVQYAFANVYFVSLSGNDNSGDGSSGNPWRTLKSAVAKVPAGQGHTIRLSAGTFVESGSFNVPPGINIEGAGIDQTIIKAASSFYFNPADPGFALDKFLMTLSSSTASAGNQSLKNFTVDGDGKKLHGGIYVKNRNNILIEGIKVKDTNFCGIWIWDVKNSTLKQVTLINCSWGSTGWASGGLQLANLESVELTGLNIDESTGYGIKALGSGGNKISKMKVHDSRISVNPAGKWNNGSAPNIAFELWEVLLTDCEIYNTYMDNHLSLVNVQTAPTGGRSIRVHHNVFDLLARAGGHGYGIELSINDAEIDHNVIKGGSYGIAHWSPAYCANWSVHHNTFHSLSSGYPGDILRAQVSGIHNVKFYNNTVELTGTATINVIGLHAGKSDNLDLKNNLLINSNTSYSWFPNQLIFMENGATVSGLQVGNNLFDKLPVGTIAGTYTNNLTVSCQITQSGVRPDPYYLPKSGSPLIDGGVNVGFPFQGSAPDIGALEHGAITLPANQPPAVNLTAPANNANFSAGSSITLTATASDKDGTVSKVEFYNGNTKLGEDSSSPYSFEWTNVVSGNYSLTAKATDNLGATSTSSQVSISVAAANALPTVSITSPAPGAVFPAGSAITVTANAADANGTISKVEFFDGTNKLGEDTTSPYSFVWSNAGAGNHTISAKATDNQGGTSTSSKIDISVTAPNALPTVTITSPSANAVFSAGSSVTITANAADANGTIAKVEFFAGTVKLGEDTSSPYSFLWNNGTAGEYLITAKATDNHGGATTSTAISITINSANNTANTAPVVTITSPLSKTIFPSGSTVTIMANASDAQGVITKVEFFNGASKLGEDTSVPYAYVWNSVQDGDYTLSAKATNGQGITATDQVEIIVRSNPLADAGEDVTVTLPSNSVQMDGIGQASDGSSVVFHWNQISGPNEISISDGGSYAPTINNLIEGTYIIELTVTDTNGLTSKDQVEIRVMVSEASLHKIPRYFTPNDDGINDRWEWPNLENYANSALTIFNRAGQKIFETESYQNTWDGTLSGKPLQPDSYYYIIKLNNSSDLKGAVRIIR